MLVQRHSAAIEQYLVARRQKRQEFVTRWEGEKADMLRPDGVEPTFKSLQAGGQTLKRCPVKQEATAMAYSADHGVHNTSMGAAD
eukprot:SAG22_NODE_14969_length_360_cov_1.088123_2_plen_84_part_01